MGVLTQFRQQLTIFPSSGGGVSTTDLSDAIATYSATQAAVDAAQDAANLASQAVQDAAALAEEADDDTVDAAQDALIQANAANDVAQSNLIAALEAANTVQAQLLTDLENEIIGLDYEVPQGIVHATARAGTIVGSFVAPFTGTIDITVNGNVSVGGMGFSVKSTNEGFALNEDLDAGDVNTMRANPGLVFLDAGGSTRVSAANPTQVYQVPIVEGEEYTMMAYAGGGSTVDSLSAVVGISNIHNPAPQNFAIEKNRLAIELFESLLTFESSVDPMVWGTARAASPLQCFIAPITGVINVSYKGTVIGGNGGLVITSDPVPIGLNEDMDSGQLTTARNGAGVVLDTPNALRLTPTLSETVYQVNVVKGTKYTSIAFAGANSSLDVMSSSVLGGLHDPIPQDSRITALENAPGGGVTPTDLQNAVDAVEAAQLIVDQAQDAAAAVEETDDDAVNAAQDALIAANDTLAQANATLAAMNATDLAQEITARQQADAVLQNDVDGRVDKTSNETIGGVKTFTGGLLQLNNTDLDMNTTAGGTVRIEFKEGGTEGANFQATHNNISDTWNMQLGLVGVGLSRLSFNQNNLVSSTRFRVPSTVAGDNGDTATSKDYVDAQILAGSTATQTLQTALDAEVIARGAGDNALDTRVAALEAQDFAALMADVVANMTEITANDGEIATLVANVALNNTAALANQAAIATVASDLATEATDRANADATLQGNIDAEALARTNADTAEQTARTNADNALDVRVTDIETQLAARIVFAVTPATGVFGGQLVARNDGFNNDNNLYEGHFKITEDPASATPLTVLSIAENETKTIYLIGAQQNDTATAFTGFVIGQELEVTNIDGRLSFTPVGVVRAFTNNDYVNITWNTIISNDFGATGPAYIDEDMIDYIFAGNFRSERKYIYGHGFRRTFVDDQVNTVSSMADVAALVAEVNTTGLPAGTYLVRAIGQWGYNTGTTDYWGALYDDSAPATNVTIGAAADTSLSYIKQEPKDVAGTDPDGGTAGTDQRHPFTLEAYVTLAAGTTKKFQYRHRPGANGVAATVNNLNLTIMRVSD